MKFYENLEDAMKHLTTRGAFLTVKDDTGVNTMTIAWGYIGYSWNKPFFVAMVRPQRYTFEFLKTAKDYTISIPFSADMKEALTICGTKSGRDIDKIKESNLEVIHLENGITYKDFKRVYLCKKIYQAPFVKEGFINNEETIEKYYKDEPFHNVYIGEIIKVYEK